MVVEAFTNPYVLKLTCPGRQERERRLREVVYAKCCPQHCGSTSIFDISAAELEELFARYDESTTRAARTSWAWISARDAVRPLCISSTAEADGGGWQDDTCLQTPVSRRRKRF